MGDRVSIQFVNGAEKSVVLFSHWNGMDFVDGAKAYARELCAEMIGTISDPLGRLEPATVMVDFISNQLSGNGRIRSNFYLGVDENDGDNSDNGHHKIDLGETLAEVKKLRGAKK
jgi:hypothetical protein